MGHWFRHDIVEPGKLPLLLALGPFRNIRPGGI